jgi:hypothetical protein
MGIAEGEITPLSTRLAVKGEAEHRRAAALLFETEPHDGSLCGCIA